jgi:hypothetical protein
MAAGTKASCRAEVGPAVRLCQIREAWKALMEWPVYDTGPGANLAVCPGNARVFQSGRVLMYTRPPSPTQRRLQARISGARWARAVWRGGHRNGGTCALRARASSCWSVGCFFGRSRPLSFLSSRAPRRPVLELAVAVPSSLDPRPLPRHRSLLISPALSAYASDPHASLPTQTCPQQERWKRAGPPRRPT